jgi:hypothetical protein
MIGEAIDELAEDGGSEEDSISAFIRARHPGVPPAHDRFLRHYLGKHVAEGFFLRNAAGRFERNPEENAAEELPVEQTEAGSCNPASVGSLVVDAKHGRGRPPKDGYPSTPPEGRKDGGAGAQWMTPHAGSSSTLAAAAKGSVLMSPVAAADKDESRAPSLKPKRRRRLRRQGMATTADSSGEALVAGKKDSREEHEPPRELALVILDDSSNTPTMDKACTKVPPTTRPVDGGQPLDLSATPKGRRRQRKSVAVATGGRSALTPGKKLGCKVSSASPKFAPVVAAGCRTPASVADQGGRKASATLKRHGRPRKLYPVSADEISDDPEIALLALPSPDTSGVIPVAPKLGYLTWSISITIVKRNAQDDNFSVFTFTELLGCFAAYV